MRDFLRRCARIALCAAVVTATSVALDPGRIVWFGVLHCILACSLIVWPLRSQPALAAVLGTIALTAGVTVADPRFDGAAFWTGLGTTIPATYDYQPFVRFCGVSLLGVALATVAPPSVRSAGPARGLAFLGRNSLLIYMAHVPILAGAMELLRRWT